VNLNGIQRFGNRSVRLLQKHSPTILTIAGAGGVVATGILAGKATIQAVPLFEDLQERVLDVKQRIERGDPEYQKELFHVYRMSALDIAKVYAPAALAALGSIACIISAHGIMKRRNVALIAAVQLLEKSFNDYRKRVVEEFGEDKDRDYRLGIFEEKTVDPETGKKTTVRRFDPNAMNHYAKIFDEGNPNWEPDPEYNLGFLKIRQEQFNQRLQTKGHLFLNYVYEELGFEPTKAGAICGWVIGKDGDNYVDIGLYAPDDLGQHRFINGLERSIILNFNVDGVIIDKI